MESDNDFMLMAALSTDQRALRLRLAHPEGLTDSLLLPQSIQGEENLCGGLVYRVLCVCDDVTLPLKSLIGLAAQLQIVTDRGELHDICGFVTEASTGQSDGGLATYQLVVRDALAIMALRRNTRVFRDKNEIDIIDVVLREWRERNTELAVGFDVEFAIELQQRDFPRREFTMQCDETDADFIFRLLRRRGIAWFFRAGRARAPANDASALPVHTLVMFDEQATLRENAAGAVRYHRADPTEERDSVTAWGAVRCLRPGSVTGFSWDYGDPLGREFMRTNAQGLNDQGPRGNRMAADLNDYHLETPHVGDSYPDHGNLSSARMAHHDLLAKHFHGESTVRDLRVGEWITLLDHPELDRHAEHERRFVITSLQVEARNNLPKDVDERIERLFMRSGWRAGSASALDAGATVAPYRNSFTCVRRGIKLAPAYDPRKDVPRARLQSALVVGPSGEEVHCDQQGRVKIRFPATRAADHAHASGTGASDSNADSAWVRVATNWAGDGPGSLRQFGTLCLPRVGSEVLIAFVDDDPDKPIIVGQVYNRRGTPPALSRRGDLPGNRYLSGKRSREIHAVRGNQLCFDDTTGQISAQLASDEAASQLNLGWLTEPRANGQARARGEGAELRSDLAAAVRGGAGVLITAAIAPNAAGPMLARGELEKVAASMHKLADQLEKLAIAHARDEKAAAELAQLVKSLQHLSQATDAGEANGGDPIVAVSGPAGVIVGSGQCLALGALADVDIVSSADTHVSTGGVCTLRSARGLNMYTHAEGAKLIATEGKVIIQAQDDAMEVLAKKVMELISTTDWINIKAKQGVRINGGGSELVISADGIHGFTGGDFQMHATTHAFCPPSAKPTQFPGFKVCASRAGGAAQDGSAVVPLR